MATYRLEQPIRLPVENLVLPDRPAANGGAGRLSLVPMGHTLHNAERLMTQTPILSGLSSTDEIFLDRESSVVVAESLRRAPRPSPDLIRLLSRRKRRE